MCGPILSGMTEAKRITDQTRLTFLQSKGLESAIATVDGNREIILIQT